MPKKTTSPSPSGLRPTGRLAKVAELGPRESAMRADLAWFGIGKKEWRNLIANDKLVQAERLLAKKLTTTSLLCD